MKKRVFILLALVFTFALTACGSKLSSLTINGAEDKNVLIGETIDLLEGVTVKGSDDKDYSSFLKVTVDGKPIDNNKLTSLEAKEFTVVYSVSVDKVKENVTIKVTFVAEPTTYIYHVGQSEIKVTLDPETSGRAIADGGYVVHGKYIIKENYIIFYGKAEETGGVEAIWKYLAGDGDLEILGGMVGAFLINDDNTLTKVSAYGYSIRGSQAMFVYDNNNPTEIMMISSYENDFFHTIGKVRFLKDDVIYLYGDNTGGDPSWGPMLWPSVKGAYKINVLSETVEVNNTFTKLSLYYVSNDEDKTVVIINDNEAAVISISEYGIFHGIGSSNIANLTLTLSGEATNTNDPGATSVWQQIVGVYSINEESSEITKLP